MNKALETYLKANQKAFKIYTANNFDNFIKDKELFDLAIKRYARELGYGLGTFGDEGKSIISSTYSPIYVKGLFNTSLLINGYDNKKWIKYIYEGYDKAIKN